MSEQQLTDGFKAHARSCGADIVGIASIDRFDGLPAAKHPASILPEAKSVIVVGKRIIRGGWRGIEEGTYWPSYTYFDYHGLLNAFFIPNALYDLACFIEDHGWEAVPLSTGRWRASGEFPSGFTVEGHARLQLWGEAGSYGIEGSKGCMISCFNYLEQSGRIEQTFHGGQFIKRPRWRLSSKCGEGTGKG